MSVLWGGGGIRRNTMPKRHAGLTIAVVIAIFASCQLASAKGDESGSSSDFYIIYGYWHALQRP